MKQDLKKEKRHSSQLALSYHLWVLFKLWRIHETVAVLLAVWCKWDAILLSEAVDPLCGLNQSEPPKCKCPLKLPKLWNLFNQCLIRTEFEICMKLAQRLQKRNKVRKKWAGRVSAMGDMRGSYRVSVGKPGGKRSCCRHRRKRNDNIKKHF
jgi:hypothetical protein